MRIPLPARPVPRMFAKRATVSSLGPQPIYVKRQNGFLHHAILIELIDASMRYPLEPGWGVHGG